MSDLIGRMAVLDALAKEEYRDVEDYRTAVRAIGSLPPVEPTNKAICEHFYKGYCSRFEDGCFGQCQKEPERPKRTETMMVNGEPTEIDPLSYEVGYSHGQSERPQGEWIPVSERLPKEEEKTYWVCTDTEYQCECRWTNNRFGIGVAEWGWSIFDTPQYTKPIAWMPLPEPYKESDKE